MPPCSLQLRKPVPADLATFFLFQLDEEANYMAAFTAKDPADREAYFTKWRRLIADPSINMQSIMYNGTLVGSVFTWLMDGAPQISYGVGKPFWGLGIATAALHAHLAIETVRPLYG